MCIRDSFFCALLYNINQCQSIFSPFIFILSFNLLSWSASSHINALCALLFPFHLEHSLTYLYSFFLCLSITPITHSLSLSLPPSLSPTSPLPFISLVVRADILSCVLKKLIISIFPAFYGTANLHNKVSTDGRSCACACV